MPIESTINNAEKIIYSTCSGIMTQEDFDHYIDRVWRTNEHYYFNEVFDTTQADWNDFEFNYLFHVAKAAASLNTINPETKLAWVVLEGKQKELTDFYKAAKSLTLANSRGLEAFYSKDKAMDWLQNM